MKEVKKEISLLRDNVSSMIDLIAELRKSMLILKQELGIFRTENDNLNKQVQFLEEKNKMVVIASAIDPEKRNEMKQKIRELVREIDGCIVMVKN